MNKLATLLGALALAGCITPPQPQTNHTDAQREAAARLYFKCLTDKAEIYDDRVSDANTIARTIWPMCTQEFSYKVRTLDMTAPSEDIYWRKYADQRQQKDAVTAVLAYRAKQANRGKPGPQSINGQTL